MLGPLLVAVLRQEIPSVELDGGPVSGRLALPTGRRGGSLEGFEVRPQLSIRAQHEPLVLGSHISGALSRIECPARRMEGLTKVVGGRLLPQIRPERVHNLLAVETVVRSEGEQLDEARRLTKAPLPPVDRPISYGDRETAEQLEANR